LFGLSVFKKYSGFLGVSGPSPAHTQNSGNSAQKSPRGFFHFLRLLCLALIGAWVIGLGSLSFDYVNNLTLPGCVTGAPEPASFEPVSLHTPDGFTLNGWYHPPANGSVILLLAGNGGSRDAMLPDAMLLARHGYGALTLDYRNCAGGRSSLGYREADDLRLMADFALAQPGVSNLGAMGFSAGSAAVIRGAARLPEIQAVVAEGNYYSLDYEIRNAPAVPFSLEWQIQNLVVLSYRGLVGVWPAKVSPAGDLPALSPRPVLLIFGEKEMVNNRGYDQLAAAREPKQLWVVPGVGHGGYYQAWPEDYERRIIQFFDQAFSSQ
jgi:uncharacterized protein